MNYKELKDKHTKEFSEVPIFWAFSNEQFDEGLKKQGIVKGEKLVSIGAGGYLRKTDVPILDAVIKKHNAEKKEFRKQDKELIKAIEYELGNHEFIITYDPSDTIAELDLDMENERILKCFNIARTNYLTWQENNG